MCRPLPCAVLAGSALDILQQSAAKIFLGAKRTTIVQPTRCPGHAVMHVTHNHCLTRPNGPLHFACGTHSRKALGLSHAYNCGPLGGCRLAFNCCFIHEINLMINFIISEVDILFLRLWVSGPDG